MLGRELARLRNRLVRRPLPVWYSPAYRLPISGVEASIGLEPRRSDYVAWWLRDSWAVGKDALRTPERATFEDLDRVHTLELLESLGRPETLARIFTVDPSDVPTDELMHTVQLACGGTIAASREAIARRGPTLNLQGGFHHAMPGSAGGLCPVNDVAVAIEALRADGFDEAIAVLDLDAHPPDGIAACVRHDAGVWVGSLSASDWGPLPGVDEVVLPEGTSDEPYLEALRELVARMPRATLTFVIAGGDVLAGDRMGRLGLTLEGARRRDRVVARRLRRSASVWLPGGGYHRDSWRVLAGTGMVLALRWDAPVPERYDPLSARFAGISARLVRTHLGEGDFSATDLEEALGLSRPKGQRLLLGYYTATGLEHALFRYGVIDQLARIGYDRCRIVLDRVGQGERARLFGRTRCAAGDPAAQVEEHLLVELVVERRAVGSADVLFVHWLSLRHPHVQFSPLRPRLPGQDVPGLGLAREMGELLALMARRLALAGVVFRPAYYHVAYSARHNFTFVDAARQGRFEALVRDLAHLPLLEATLAVSDGRVLLDGEPYAWEATDMALWLRGAARPDPEEVKRERDGRRFTLAPSDGAARER